MSHSKKAIFTDSLPKTSEATDLSDLSIIQSLSFDHLFENLGKKNPPKPLINTKNPGKISFEPKLKEKSEAQQSNSKFESIIKSKPKMEIFSNPMKKEQQFKKEIFEPLEKIKTKPESKDYNIEKEHSEIQTEQVDQQIKSSPSKQYFFSFNPSKNKFKSVINPPTDESDLQISASPKKMPQNQLNPSSNNKFENQSEKPESQLPLPKDQSVPILKYEPPIIASKPPKDLSKSKSPMVLKETSQTNQNQNHHQIIQNHKPFKVFDNKENNNKLPPKMDVSNVSSRFMNYGSDSNQEIMELRTQNKKYEDKIDSLIRENLRMSNKLQEFKKEKSLVNLNNKGIEGLEIKVENLLQENQKLSQIIEIQEENLRGKEENLLRDNHKLREMVKFQAENLKEKESLIQKKDQTEEKLREILEEKDDSYNILLKKIEGYKKENLKSNQEKSQILEELMVEKMRKHNGDFQEESEGIIRELKKEIIGLKEENTRLNEKIRSLMNIKGGSEVKSKKKLDSLHETFDTLALLNEKLNVHLDAIQAKSCKNMSERKID